MKYWLIKLFMYVIYCFRDKDNLQNVIFVIFLRSHFPSPSCILIQFFVFFFSVSCKRGRVDDFSFFDCSSPFCCLLIEFHCTFQFPIKYYQIMIIIIVFRLGSESSSPFSSILPLPRDQSRDVTPRFGEGRRFLIFDC